MKTAYGASAQALGILSFYITQRLLEVLRAKGVLSDEDVKNLLNAAAADAGTLGTVAGTEASQILSEVARGGDMGNA